MSVIKKKRCIICGKWYIPCRNTWKHQKCCGNKKCVKELKSRANKSWCKRHPGYAKSRKLKVQAWAKSYPNYWSDYRRRHPEYRARDNIRRCKKAKRVNHSAKQAEYRKIAVDKLSCIAQIGPEFSAKQDVYYRRVDGLIDYLFWKESSAKQHILAFQNKGMP